MGHVRPPAAAEDGGGRRPALDPGGHDGVVGRDERGAEGGGGAGGGGEGRGEGGGEGGGRVEGGVAPVVAVEEGDEVGVGVVEVGPPDEMGVFHRWATPDGARDADGEVGGWRPGGVGVLGLVPGNKLEAAALVWKL